MRIEVPFIEQSLDFTCGPACLAMALHHFDPALPLDRALELDLWREATTVESPGTSALGLALAARRRGFDARVVNNVEGMPLRARILEHFPGSSTRLLDMFYQDVVRKCRLAGVVPEIRPVSPEDLDAALERGELPILLTSTRISVPDEHIPHWVLVTGHEADAWFINNPYVDEGRRVDRLSDGLLRENLGWEGEQSLVLLSSG